MGSKSNNLRRLGSLEIDLENRIVWMNDEPSGLPAKAVDLFCVLLENEGKVLSKDELLEQVWQGSFVEEGVLSQNIYLLRKLFRQNGFGEEIIQTIPRKGYRFLLRQDLYNPDNSAVSEIVIEREITEATYSSTVQIGSDQNLQLRSRPRPALPRLGWWLGSGAVVVLAAIASYALLSGSSSNDHLGAWVANAGGVKYENLSTSGRAFYAGLSPDGKNAAYVIHTADNRYALNLFHFESKSETAIIDPQELQIFNVQFSPDGNSIFYAGFQGDKRTAVFRIPLYGGSPQVVTKDLTHHFSLSPDGRWIAFYRMVAAESANYLDICRSSDCSERRTVAARYKNDGFSLWGAAPAWSPDGKKFAAAVHSRGSSSEPTKHFLAEIDIVSGEQKPIKTPDWYTVHQPYWQPDGNGLFVMVRERRGEPIQIWHLSYPTGIGTNITNDENDYREFRVSPDLSFILAATWSKSENIYLVPANDPKDVRQLTFDVNARNGERAIAWTRDGKSLVYSRNTGPSVGNLWKLDLDSGRSQQLTFGDDATPHYAETTPDGRSVIFGYDKGGTSQLWQVGLNGEELHQISEGPVAAAPEISPDDKWLYYLSDGLWKRPLDSGPAIKVLEKGPGTVRVSPAEPGLFAAYYYDRNETAANPWKFVLFNEDDPGRFTDLNIAALIYFEWKPDGSGIYFADNGESYSNIWFRSITDMSVTKITDFGDQRIGNFAISPDGGTFAISRGSAIGRIVKITPHPAT